MTDWFDAAGNGSAVDLEALWDSQIPEGVIALVAAGALVSLGTTSDGGALGITVTLDGRWRREYFRETELAVAWLKEALVAVENERSHASPGPRKRTRRS